MKFQGLKERIFLDCGILLTPRICSTYQVESSQYGIACHQTMEAIRRSRRRSAPSWFTSSALASTEVKVGLPIFTSSIDRPQAAAQAGKTAIRCSEERTSLAGQTKISRTQLLWNTGRANFAFYLTQKIPRRKRLLRCSRHNASRE